jgi:4-amino-4-deoxy-L-arabinose transferase-like glycosyltransferase
MWSFVKRLNPFWVTVLFLLGCTLFTRLYLLGQAPTGITWDEAALGYIGKMVITTGRDEHLDLLPTTFRSFGDFKAPLAIYIVGIFTRILGVSPLTVRLPFALAGMGSIILISWLAYRLTKSTWHGLLAGFLTLTLPWHFLFSRVGFEVGLVMFFVLLLLVSWVEAHNLIKQSPWWQKIGLLLVMTGSVGASLYTYHSAKIVIPLTLGLMLWHDWFNARTWLRQQWKFILSFIGLLALGSGPLIWDSVLGAGLERSAQTSWLGTLELIPSLERLANNYAVHFSFGFLVQGDTTTLRHGTPEYGVFLYTHLIFFWLGLTFALGRLWQNWHTSLTPNRIQKITQWLRFQSTPETFSVRSWFWLALLLITILPATIGNEIPHANRALLAIIPAVMLMVLGVRELQSELPRQHFASIVGSLLLFLLLQFGVFWRYYFSEYQAQASEAWLEGYEPAVKTAKEYLNQGKLVKFSDELGEPLIFYAFYTGLPFEEYRNFQITNLTTGPVIADDLNVFDVLIATPNELLPAQPTRTILRKDNQPAFYIYEIQ